MADEVAKAEQNHYRVATAVTNDSNQYIKMFRVDPTSLGLIVAGATQGGGYSTITSGSQSNSSTTTAVGLVAISTPCKLVVITVPTGNSYQQVSIGGSNAVATIGSEIGHIMISGSSQGFYITDASNLYLAVGTANDKVSYNIFN